MAPQKTQPKSSSLTPLLLLVVSGLLVFLAAEQDRQGKPQTLSISEPGETDLSSVAAPQDSSLLSGVAPQDPSNLQVNQHLFLTDQKIYWEQERQRLENLRSKYQALPDSSGSGEFYSASSNLDFEPDARESHLLGDLKRDRKKIEDYLGPESKIQSQILEDQALLQHQERMRREYAEQFVRNARAGGYEVVLDEQYNIKSVKPLRKDNQRLPGSLLSRPKGTQ